MANERGKTSYIDELRNVGRRIGMDVRNKCQPPCSFITTMTDRWCKWQKPALILDFRKSKYTGKTCDFLRPKACYLKTVCDRVPIPTVDILDHAGPGLTQEFLTLGSWIEFKEDEKGIHLYFHSSLPEVYHFFEDECRQQSHSIIRNSTYDCHQ